MKYYFELYLSEELKERREEIIDKIEHQKIMINKYLIVLTKNERNHLEFFDSAMLGQEIFDRDSLFVIGIADGRYGAMALVQKIVQEVHEETGQADIRRYLLDKQKDFEEGRR